jgi:hypothetical protein
LCPAAAALLAFSTVRILLDYRPALKERTGVGEYAHELAAGLARQLQAGDELVLFTSSWADRPDPDVAAGWPRTRWWTGVCQCACSPTPGIAWGGPGSTGWPGQPTSCSRSIHC